MKKIAFVLILLSLSLNFGCTRYVESSNLVTKPNLNVVDPSPLELEAPTVFVIENLEQYKKVITELAEQGIDPVLIAVTDDGYVLMSINDNKKLEYIQAQRAIIEAYRKYYEAKPDAPENVIDKLKNF